MKLIGPFTQALTMDHLTSTGHLHDNDLQIIEQAGIVVDHGTIKAVGSFEELSREGHLIEEIDTPMVLLPGFIDAHTHICFAGNRSADYSWRLQGKSPYEIAASGGGIMHTTRETRKASEKELVDLLLERTKKLVKRGITTAEVKSGYGLNVIDEVKMLKAIHMASKRQPVTLIPTCLAAHIRPEEFDSSTEYLSYLVQDLLIVLRSLDLTRRVDILVEEGAFTIDQARPFLNEAKKLGYALCLHADQFSRGGALLAAEMRAVSADHLEASQDEDFAALKSGCVTPIVLPGASLGLGIPFAKAKSILDHDLPLVIASDWNPGSAPMGCLLTQASLLAIAEKISTAETLAAITCRAAHALQLADRGILKAGKKADLIGFPTNDYRDILYYQGTLQPSSVFIDGSKI